MKVSDFGICGIDNGDVYLLFKEIDSNNMDWSWFNLDDTVKKEVNGAQVYGKQLRLQEDAIVVEYWNGSYEMAEMLWTIEVPLQTERE